MPGKLEVWEASMMRSAAVANSSRSVLAEPARIWRTSVGSWAKNRARSSGVEGADVSKEGRGLFVT